MIRHISGVLQRFSEQNLSPAKKNLPSKGGVLARVRQLNYPKSAKIHPSTEEPLTAPSTTSCLTKLNPMQYRSSEKSGLKQPPTLEQVRQSITAKAEKKGLKLPSFQGKHVDKNKTLTIVMHGTGQAQHKDQILSRVAEASVKSGEDVIVLNGLGTSTKDAAAHEGTLQQQGNGDVTLMASHGKKSKRGRILHQELRGSGIFKNAHSVVDTISQMETIPGKMKLVGFSRGGVTATVTAALLDASLAESGASDKHPDMLMTLFDPVPGAGKNKALYSRDVLANNPHYTESNTLVLKSGTDTRTTFVPQKGSVAGDREVGQIFAGTHSGIVGKSQHKKGHEHHKDIAIITERMTFDFLGLNLEDATLDLSDSNVLDASVKLALVQEDKLAEVSAKRQTLTTKMRAEGKALQAELQKNTLASKLFVSPQVRTIFEVKFPQHAKIIATMEKAEARGAKDQVAGSLMTAFNATSAHLKSQLTEQDQSVLQKMSAVIQEWATVP